MLTLNDIQKWVPLEDGEVITFAGQRPRPIMLEVNTSEKAVLMIHLKGEDTPRLLALVEGRETLSFVVPGPFDLMHRTPGADVYVLAADGSKVHREGLDLDAYTTLHERRARNPEIEYMQYLMNQNIEKRLAKQAETFERRLASVNRGTGSESGGSQPAERNADGGAPVESAGGNAAAQGGGGAGDNDGAVDA